MLKISGNEPGAPTTSKGPPTHPYVRVPGQPGGRYLYNELAALVPSIRNICRCNCILAKIGVAGVDPNFATAIRTPVIVVFTWAIAFMGRSSSREYPPRAERGSSWDSLVSLRGCHGYAISVPCS